MNPLEHFTAILEKRDGALKEFNQAALEVIESLLPAFEKEPELIGVFERLLEPERVLMFRVPWINDAGKIEVNRGFRVEYNSAIGPYKGGLRFHPSVNLSVLKFLGFEQIFKNSLTTLPMGGGKGGSDFDPKGKSDNEVMRFCQSFMTELSRHIGPNTDVPAGDIGVGGREIGYMFGQYKRLRNEFTGVLTGKGLSYGGSLIRPEATGYGTTFFADNMLHWAGKEMKGLTCLVSGSGNVAQFACRKILQLGGKPLTVSDSNGHIYVENGIDEEFLLKIMDLKNVKRGRLSELDGVNGAVYVEGKRPWMYKADMAFPCATQNEVDEEDAKRLVENGIFLISEGANMPSTPEAIEVFHKHEVLYGPAKAANAGGVAVSGLEMCQNSARLAWTEEEVENRLRDIMATIFNNCAETAETYGVKGRFDIGANIAGFLKVAEAMKAQGCV